MPALPSMTALRVFEATSRHLSFTGAAEELFMTQSAVSKQIRTLEEAFNVTLFIRVSRGLVLTELGRSFLAEIRPSLNQLSVAAQHLTEAARSTTRSALTLRILAVIGDRWLLPRLEHFVRAHPNIDVQFTAFMASDASEQKQPDAEVRYGEGSWPGYVADYLFGRDMLLVASPRLLASRPLDSAADVARFPLLEHPQVADAWPSFFAKHGLDPAGMSRDMRHEFYTILVRCAVSGLGLGLIPAVWVQDEIARGELVNPLALGVTMRQGYHFLVPESKQSQPALVTLRAWILAEAQGTPGATAAGLRPAPPAAGNADAGDDEEP